MINLAGVETASNTIKKELLEAKIDIVNQESKGEVPYTIIGRLNGWSFRRAWYYYVAKADEGYDLDLDKAEKFHQEYGKEVRVAGHCGCPSPLEWWNHEWSKASLYHIDTQKGLNAFAEFLRDSFGD